MFGRQFLLQTLWRNIFT